MSGNWPALIVLVVASLVYLATVLADTAVARVARGEIRRMVEQGNRSARLVDRILADKGRWIVTSAVLRVASLLAVGAAGSALIWGLERTAWQVVAAVALWLGLATAHLGARLWAQRNPAKTSLWMAPFMRAAMFVLTPVTVLMRGASDAVEDAVVSEEDTILILDDGVRLVAPSDSEEAEIEASEKEMITSILEMDETVVAELMVPRMEIVALDVDAKLSEALDVIIEAGHSRIPVYEESVDQIIGILYAKDLLKCFREDRSEVPLREMVRNAYFVPLSKNVKNLLAEMRKHRVHIAIVVDEYGGTAGLVTIEDILEEIVGEIQDEYDDAEEILVHPEGADGYLIQGKLDTYSLAKLADLDLEDEDADTAGGLVLGLLGHVPEPGESIELQGWRFTVLSVDGRRIETIRIEPIATHAAGDANADTQRTDASTPDERSSGVFRFSTSDNS